MIPKKTEVEQISIRFTKETLEKLRKISKKYNVSISQIVSQIVYKEINK
jgi:predicted DNA-binding protein